MSESAIVSKVWNFANVLRDDGVGYGDYLEQITYLLFVIPAQSSIYESDRAEMEEFIEYIKMLVNTLNFLTTTFLAVHQRQQSW